MMFSRHKCWRLDFVRSALLTNKVGESASHLRRRRNECHLIAGRIQMEQQPFNWPANGRMQHPGRDLRGWLEHKSPERHPRMRQREHRRFGDFVTVEENIDINRA